MADELRRRLAENTRSLSAHGGEVVSDHIADLTALADNLGGHVESGWG
jgi:hypothetical protein